MTAEEAAWHIVATGLLGENRPEANDALARELQNAGDLWPQIIRSADINFVTPGFWQALTDKGLDGFVPADAAQYLAAIYDMNRTRNAALELQLDELIHACNAAGITPGLIKGAAHLKITLHGDKGLRLMTDLDLVIESERLQGTVNVLTGLGYAPLPDAGIDESHHHHLPALFRAGDYGSVEVHKEPMNLEAQPCLSADELWRDSVEIHDGNLRYRVPSPTHAALLAIAHSEVADRNLKTLFISLRCLHDIVAMKLMYDSSIDWPEVFLRMQRERHTQVFRDFLYILDRLAGSQPLPNLEFGVSSRVRYFGCRFALRHPAVRLWLLRLNSFRAYRIGLRFGPQGNLLSRNWNRLRVIGSFIVRHIGSTRGSR